MEQPNLDACLFDRRAGAEASDHRHVVTSPRVHDVARIVVERNPELRLRRWETEIRRHDADNLPADAFELDRTADDGRVAAETLLPQRVAENHDLIPTGGVLAWIEASAQRGAYAENGEELRGHSCAGKPHGLPHTNHVERVTIGKCRHLHRPHLPAHLRERAVGIRSGNADELFGCGVRQRAQQHGIDDAEYRGVRGDAQRQRERGGSRKARSLAQRARAVPHVLEKCFDHVDLRSGARPAVADSPGYRYFVIGRAETAEKSSTQGSPRNRDDMGS